MNKYTYNPGSKNNIYEELVLSTAKILGEEDLNCRIFGSTALFILNKMFGKDKYGKWIQTSVECFNKTEVFLRDIDILLEIEEYNLTKISFLMNTLGNFTISPEDNDIYNLFMEKNIGVMKVVRGKLSLTQNSSLNITEIVSSSLIHKMCGDISINVNIVVIVPYCTEFWNIPSLSKNFWVKWCKHTKKFTYGPLKTNKNLCNDPLSIDHIILSLINEEYTNNLSNIPNHTSSGDPLSELEELPPELNFDNYNFNIERQIMSVLGGRDFLLTSYMKMETFVAEKNNTLMMKCPICQEYIQEYNKLFRTKCNHVFHSSCIAKYIRNYYTAILKASLAKKAITITQFNIEGDILFSDSQAGCPVCRSMVFKVDIPYLKRGKKLRDLRIKQKDLINSPFKIEASHEN